MAKSSVIYAFTAFTAYCQMSFRYSKSKKLDVLFFTYFQSRLLVRQGPQGVEITLKLFAAVPIQVAPENFKNILVSRKKNQLIFTYIEHCQSRAVLEIR